MTATIDAARAGDEAAFHELTRPYLRELHVHCYRMLGSFDDAEELLQETLLAAWQGLDGFEARSSVRTWLYRIATNRCLNAIRDAKRRPPPAPVVPFEPTEPNATVEVPWLQPYPDRYFDPVARSQSKATIELAFVSALQTMPPRQTAVLLLCDVLGFGAAETAELLGSGAGAVKGLLQRARAAMPAAVPDRDGARDDTAEHADLARRFAAAYSADDVEGVVALLTDDAWLAMPPAPHEYRGPAAVAGFLRSRGRRGLSLLPTEANGQPAFGCYVPDAAGTTALPSGIVVLTMGRGLIRGVTRFIGAGMHRGFGLPDVIEPPR